MSVNFKIAAVVVVMNSFGTVASNYIQQNIGLLLSGINSCF